jgi:hypothetical protein
MEMTTIRENYDFFSKGLYQSYLDIYKQYTMTSSKDRSDKL